MAFSLGEYGDIFLEEADEQLQELNQNLIELEKNPEDDDIINNIFRAAHSLKSSAAFVGLNDLSDLAHKMENLLQGIRDKTMEITPEIVDVIFKCFDEITSVIDTVAGGEAPTQDLSGIIELIQQVSQRGGAASSLSEEPAAPKVKSRTIEIPKLSIDNGQVSEIKEGLNNGKLCYELAVSIELEAQMRWVKAQLVLNNLEGLGDLVVVSPEPEDISDEGNVPGFRVAILTDASVKELVKACDIDLIEQIDVRELAFEKRDGKTVLAFNKVDVEMSEASSVQMPVSEVNESLSKNGAVPPVMMLEDHDDDDDDDHHQQHDKSIEHERKKTHTIKTVKVSIEKLDQLLNNVGELVVANSGFYKLYDEVKGNAEAKAFASEFKNRIEQMARIAKDLQNGIMNTRMVPIGQVFSRFNRLVRDLTHEFKKDVELKIRGEETELDKKVIDVIGEPLLHLIRNAIDHGIETVEERNESGKSETAIINLNAYQGGNQIFVEVGDDGRGLDIAVIKRKAIEKGLATPEMIDNMDNSEVYNFIFAPGFSTAKKITDISGRGVGMNVVKQTVSELNGNVSIETELGMGTKFIMAFPLTLAIIPAIMVRIRRELYAIPLSDVLDTIKIHPSEITTIEGHEVINFRGEILSVVRLNRFVGLRTSLGEEDKIPVVVVSFGSRKIGLIVDQLEGKQEIVIKSLEQNYMTVHGLAGASILGDGSICLILDIASMINKLINDQERYESNDESYLDVDAEDYEMFQDKLNEEEAKTYGFSLKKEDKDDEKIDEAQKVPEGVGDPSNGYINKLDRQTNTVIFDQEEPPADVTEEKASAAQGMNSQSVIMFDDEPAPINDEKSEEDASNEPEGEGSIQRVHRETTPVNEASTEDVDDKVREALTGFREELKNNIEQAVSSGEPNAHMGNSLDVSRDQLKEFQLLANTGAANAAESLSRILNKRIDLSIPEVSIKPIETIPQYLGDEGGHYIGIVLSILGDIKGNLFLVFSEDSSLDLLNTLYEGKIAAVEDIDEEHQSALKEVGNIIGSSILNVFAEKTGFFIHPSIPGYTRDFLKAIVDSVLALHNINDDYAIVMDTAFFFEDDRVVGSLLLMPEAESLKILVEKLKTHVGAN